MKIVLLSPANSIHTIRWANGLSSGGHEVHVISQHAISELFDQSVVVHIFPFRGILGYFTIVPKVRDLLKKIQPDIVNAHYASGYGTTARLVNYKPWILSVWGSDVYDFPYKSFVHKWLVKSNLRAANEIASTSHCMADQVRSLIPEIRNITITPFGVDMSTYDLIDELPNNGDNNLVIGTVKTMAPKYGIDILIKAFAIVLDKLEKQNSELVDNVVLRLVGGGDATNLKNLVKELGIEKRVIFVGAVSHKLVPKELAKLDIYAALSRLDSESFGVAIIEASAAGRPVIVSDVGGLPEVTVNNVTGIVVPREDPQAAAEAIEKLIFNSELRYEMGMAGKNYVKQNYDWSVCIDVMLELYEKTIKK